MRSFAADSTTWAERDDSIAVNISRVAAQRPDGRVAVVFGGGHCSASEHSGLITLLSELHFSSRHAAA
jgi:hypothetical protein